MTQGAENMITLEETVTTRYVGPTGTRGSHFVVRFRGHTRRVPYSYEASDAAAHAAQWVVDQYVENGHVLYVGETAAGNRYAVNIF